MATQSGTLTPTTAPTTTPLATGGALPRLALQADGAVCAALGTTLALGASPIAAFTGLPLAATLGLALALIPYGVGLCLRARRHSDRRLLLTIAALNGVWVVASGFMLLAGWPALTTGGSWTVGILALVVADFAALQFYAARKVG